MHFLWAKFLRLLLPLIPAIFILHIPRHFISQGWDKIGRLDDCTRIENDYLKYVPAILADNFLSKIGPLWFLPFIFQLMIMSYPLIRWTYRRRRLIPVDSVDWQLVAGYLVLWALWNLWSGSQQESKEIFWKYLFPTNVIMLIGNYSYFLIQYLLMKNFHEIDRSRFCGVIAFYGIGPAFCLLLNFFYHPTVEMTMCNTFQMFNYYAFFFAQGAFVFTWADFLHADIYHLRQTSWYVLYIIGGIFAYGCLMPGNQSDRAFLFTYPIYMTFHLNTLHVLGTWQVVYWILYLYKCELNQLFDKAFFQLINGSSLWCYIAHDLFQSALITYLILPYNFEYWHGLIATFILCEVGMLGTWVCLLRVCRGRRRGSSNRGEVEA